MGALARRRREDRGIGVGDRIQHPVGDRDRVREAGLHDRTELEGGAAGNVDVGQGLVSFVGISLESPAGVVKGNGGIAGFSGSVGSAHRNSRIFQSDALAGETRPFPGRGRPALNPLPAHKTDGSGRFNTMADHTPGFSTLAVHAGAKPDPTTGARVTPIYQTTSFVFEDVDHAASLFGLQAFGNIYTRITNPTQAVLEERVAALEGGTAALAVASGHAAQMLVFHTLLQPGDEFIASKKLYGGSINQFNNSFKNFGWNVVWADPDDVGSFERAVTPKTKAIFIESIANPGGVVTDIAAIAQVAKRAHVPLIVDNTLASPYLCRPIEHGADIVVHSATKFLGGHGNSIGGLIVDGGSFDWSREGRYPMLSEPRPEYNGLVIHETFGNFAFAIAARVLGLRDLGPAISPFNAFLILTGIETLPLRMQRHSDNAKAVAEFLSTHDKVKWVSYAGLSGDRYHGLAERLHAEGRGRRVHLRPRRRLRRGHRAREERGIVLPPRQRRRYPLADHPPGLHHAPPADRRPEDVGRCRPDVVRLSVGIEDAADIIADLAQALDAID